MQKTKFIINRLVRDNTIELCNKDGVECDSYSLNEVDFKREVLRKLVEEANEVKYSHSKENLIEELCDVMEIFNKILELNTIDIGEITEAMEKKRKIRGGFDKGIFLKTMATTKDNRLYPLFIKHYKIEK